MTVPDAGGSGHRTPMAVHGSPMGTHVGWPGMVRRGPLHPPAAVATMGVHPPESSAENPSAQLVTPTALHPPPRTAISLELVHLSKTGRHAVSRSPPSMQPEPSPVSPVVVSDEASSPVVESSGRTPTARP